MAAFATFLKIVSSNKLKNRFLFSDETTFESRQELLARVPSLTSLNGSPVSSSEISVSVPKLFNISHFNRLENPVLRASLY